MGQSWPVRSGRRQGVVDIGDAKDPRREGNLIALQSIGITSAVPTLVVVADDCSDVAWKVDVRDELESGFGVVLVGMFLGALESLASFTVGSGWREAPGLILLILALAVRPTGVFGKTAIRKV